MRSLPAFLALMFIFAASAASADSRVFIVANQPDGYGVDQCLARGEKCGAHAALSYCGRGILPRRRRTGASTRMKSPARFRRPARTATMPVATNTSQLPASAKAVFDGKIKRLAPPHRRPGNDVTLPREAAMGGPVGRAFPFDAARSRPD